MTSQDFGALTVAQREVLGLVAIGQDGWVRKRAVLKQLAQLGLIEGREELVYGTGNSPIDRVPVKVMRYEVPLDVHIAWCAWCASQPVKEAP